MAHRALTDVMLGNQPPAHAGELIPDTFTDTSGGQVPVDLERLVEMGAAEKIEEPKRSRKAQS